MTVTILVSALQQMLGVCDASLVSPGRLVLGVKVGVCDVEIVKIRKSESFQIFMGGPTHM